MNKSNNNNISRFTSSQIQHLQKCLRSGVTHTAKHNSVRQKIATQLSVSYTRVTNWFRNNRHNIDEDSDNDDDDDDEKNAMKDDDNNNNANNSLLNNE